MRLSVALLFLAGWLVNIRTYAQRVSFSVEHTTLEKELSLLEVLGHCIITRNGNHTQFHDLSVTVVNATIEEALEQCIRDLPFNFEVTDSLGIKYISLRRYRWTRLKGHVYSTENEPLEDVSVQILPTPNGVMTNADGCFRLSNLTDTVLLVISGVNIETQYVRPEGRRTMDITVKKKARNLTAHTVIFDNGYNPVKASTAPPGSWFQLRRPALDRIPAIDPTSILRAQGSSIMLGTGTKNSLHMAIRGMSTLNAVQEPLVVLDNFPYTGDLRDINLNDIESITILKDPVASSIWGARSGNGVLIYTSRKGGGKGPHLAFVTNTAITVKPDLGYQPLLRPGDDTFLEKLFFQRHFYDAALLDASHPAVPPVVIVLDQLQRGLITQEKADELIKEYGQHSIQKDLSKYFYQTAVWQQYHLSMSSGSTVRNDYFSLGYDVDPTNLRRNNFERITIQGSNNWKWLSGKLQLCTQGHFSKIVMHDNNSGNLPVNYTYAQLAGPSGEAMPVNYRYNPEYTSTQGGGHLRDWSFRPLQELNLADNSTRITDYHGQISIRYSILPGLSAEGMYRWMKGEQIVRNRYDKDGFYVRDLTNLFTQLNTPDFSTAIPAGDIMDKAVTINTSENMRGQLSYNHPGGFSGIRYVINAGADRSQQTMHNESMRYYGYNPNRGTNILVDPITVYTDIMGMPRQIPMNQNYQDLYVRYLSFFANMDVTLKGKYTVYMSAKKDGTNIIGVDARKRWWPFWALGLGYDATKKSRDTLVFPHILKGRLSIGCNGNIGSRTGYLVTQSLVPNNYGDAQSGISNPPDGGLTWERSYMLNAGLDYGVWRDSLSPQGRLQGSIECFTRWGRGLLGNDTLAPSSGLTGFFGNTATMDGWGFDVVLNTENIRGRFGWTSSLLLTYASDKVTNYRFVPSSAAGYTQFNTPKQGRPLSSLFSYRSAGLDPTYGDPQGYKGNDISKDYNSIVNAKGDTGIIYSGNYQPKIFGGMTNTFTWKRWSLSSLMEFKAFFVFRRPSMNYYAMVSGSESGNADYHNSWRTPGDEKRTTVPSPPLTNDRDRSTFYAYSQSTITRGDYVRLQDVRLAYEFSGNVTGKAPAWRMTAYFAINNMGIIWRANKNGIDPNAFNYGEMPAPKSYITGLRIEF